jgi:hypothetical protein
MALHKIFKIIALIFGIIGIGFFVNLLIKGNDTVVNTGAGVDGYIYVTYAILALITLIVIFYVLKGVFAGNIKKTLFTLLGFAVIIIIAYVLADGVETPLKDGGTLSASGSKWVGTGLYTFYIMALLAIAAMVWTGVTKLINR